MRTRTGLVVAGCAMALVLALAFGRGAAAADEGPLGVYVNNDCTYQRVEFLPGGKCFLRLCGECEEGEYSCKDGSLLCTVAGRTAFRLKVQGDVLVGQDGERWVTRDDLLVVPWDAQSPVTMVVVDMSTGEPIPEFTYEYMISAPEGDYDPMLVRPIGVKSPDGSFTIQAPPSCEISIEVEGRDLVRGYGTSHTYDLTSACKDRRIEVRAEKGITVQGTVTDAQTGKPIGGARVSPIVFRPPAFPADERRSVLTDASGSFTAYGVNPCLGINVSHIDYFKSRESEFSPATDGVAAGCHVITVGLKTGETLRGKVSDPSGKPIAGVRVGDGAGKEVHTDEDGLFVLKSPEKWARRDSYDLSFKKDGYFEETLCPKPGETQGIAVVLRPCPVLVGTVGGLDGRPVPEYRVFAGPQPEPKWWQCSSERVEDTEGRFRLAIEREGKPWVGVSAPGYAPWEALLVGWEGSRTISVQLEPGVTVTGRVAVPEERRGGVTVRLVPDRKRQGEYDYDLTQWQAMGVMHVGLSADGSFTFEHVRPGPHVLFVYSPAISPIGMDIVVPKAGLDVGALSPKGTGTVFGQIFESEGADKGAACPFAQGSIHFADTSGRGYTEESPHLRPISFTADENGRFRVEGVPVGHVAAQVCFSVLVDVIGSHLRPATVLEGQATEVRFFDPSDDWKVTFELVVGDGSAAQYATGSGLGTQRPQDKVTNREAGFIVSLRPETEGPISYAAPSFPPSWQQPDQNHCLVVQDVHPGKYHYTVAESDAGTLCEGEADFGPGNQTVRVQLGAGSITGRVRSSKAGQDMVYVVAVGRKDERLHHSRCDERGNFCIRYLPADTYDVFADAYQGGCACLGHVSVSDTVEDVRPRRLAPGATIAGKVTLLPAAAPATDVVATDRHGIARCAAGFEGASDGHFTISDLWPGDWTVVLRRNEDILAKAEVHVEGRETVTVNLREEGPAAVGADAKPNKAADGGGH